MSQRYIHKAENTPYVTTWA